MAEFKIGFADHTITNTIVIRLKTDTTVIDEAMSSQLFQNFAKSDFISRIIFILIYHLRITPTGNLSITIYIYISQTIFISF